MRDLSELTFGVEHLGLAAREPVALKDWYVRVLGGEVVFATDTTPPAFFVKLRGGLWIEIYGADAALTETQNNRLAGWQHLALRVESIVAAQERLRQAGVRFDEPIKPAGGGGQVLFFKDPEGNLLHLVERPAGGVFDKVGQASSLPRPSGSTNVPEGTGWKPLLRSIKAVVFDLDGVIVDSEPLHEQAYREVFAELGYGDSHGIDFTRYYGKSDATLWQDFVAKHQPKQPFDELLALKQNRFLEILRAEKPLFRGLPELIERLSARYKLAVASGSSHAVIETALTLENLRRFFPVVVSALDVPHGKPAPDIFLRAAELLGVAPAACCVIEDADAGVAGALAAGMAVIGITNTLPVEKLARATRVVRSYEQIERLLLHP
jgi:HAD superfamily hydrolase (TIGR01509 family)